MYQGNKSKNKSHYAHCAELLTAFRRRHIERLAGLFALLCVNIYFHVLTFSAKYGGYSFEMAKAFDLPLTDLPFAMGVVSATCSLALLFIAFFAEVKRPKLMIPFYLIAIPATVFDLIHWSIGIVIGIMYATQVIDNMRYRWVEKQPGFPHFNERLDEQLLTKQLASTYTNKSAPETNWQSGWETIGDPEDNNTWDGDVLNLDAIAKYINLDDEEEAAEQDETEL